MSSASDYLEAAVLNHIFKKSTLTAPDNIYIALCTVAVTDSMTGSTITEATYTGYSRKQTAPADWTISTSTMSNNAAITFDECTAGSSTVTYVALVDAATAGNLLFYAELSSSLAVSDGVQPYFAANDIDVTAS